MRRVPRDRRKFYAGLCKELVDEAEAIFQYDLRQREKDLIKEEKFGIRSPRLDEYSVERIPVAVRYIFWWFGDLNGCRQSNGFGPAAFSFAEMKAWSELKGVKPTPWEIDTIKALDAIWRKVWSEVHDTKSE